MDIAQVGLLLALDDAGSLSGAAERLGMTTTAVSQQLRRLEREVGGEIFVRTPHGVTAAPAAARLLRAARRVAGMVETVAAAPDAPAELVRVTTVGNAFEHVGRAVRWARERAPALRFEVREGRGAGDLLDDVRDGRSALGVGYLHPHDVEWSRRRGLRVLLVARDECCVVLPPGQEGLPDPLPVAGLPDLDVVSTTQDAVSRQMVERVLARAGVRRRVGVVTSHRAMLVPLVREGAGMAWTTLAALAPAAQEGVVVRRVVPTVALPVYVVSATEPCSPGAALVHDRLTGPAAALPRTSGA